MKKVYLETTIISYLASYPSRDLIVAANQQITQEWWHSRRSSFGLYMSQLVVQEAGVGDPEAVGRRLEIMNQLLELQLDPQMFTLAQTLVVAGAVPEAARNDSLHIAAATMSGMGIICLPGISGTSPTRRCVAASRGRFAPRDLNPLSSAPLKNSWRTSYVA